MTEIKDNQHSVTASSLVGLLAYAQALQLPTAGVLEAVGLTEAALQGAEARVPEAAYNKVWEILGRASQDPDFGLHFAERLTVGHPIRGPRPPEVPMSLSRLFRRLVTCAATLVLPGCLQDPEASTASPAPNGSGASAAPSVVAQHIAVVRQRIEASNAGNWEEWQRLHTENAQRTAPKLAAPLVGSQALRAAIEEVDRAFPDYHLELVHAFGDGEWLSVQIHATGTNTGPLKLGDMDLPATGRPIDQDWAATIRFDGNRISEIHEFYDQYLLLLELGLAPGSSDAAPQGA